MSDPSPMRDPLHALLAPAARSASDLPDVLVRLEQANADGDAPAFRARVLEAVESGDISAPPIATERIWDHPRDEADLGHGDDDIDVTRPPVLQSAATDSASGGIDTSGGGLGEVLPELPDPEGYVLDEVPAYMMSDPAEEPDLGHAAGGLDDAGM